MPLKLSNNAVSRLSSSLTDASTAMSVLPGEGAKFPALVAGDWFPLTLVKSDGSLEIVRCTERSTDLFTITRAQEGTAALAFSAGDRVELRATRAAFEEISTNAREWTASEVTQAEAEEGEATAARKWTAQRVRQAIVAGYNALTSAFGRTLANSADAAAARTKLALGSAAISDLSPEVLAPGVSYVGRAIQGGTAWTGGEAIDATYIDGPDRPSGPYSNYGATGTLPYSGFSGVMFHQKRGSRPVQYAIDYVENRFFTRGYLGTAWTSWAEYSKVGHKHSVAYSGAEYVMTSVGGGAFRLPAGYVVTGINKGGSYSDTNQIFARQLQAS